MAASPFRVIDFPKHIVDRVARGMVTLGQMSGGAGPMNQSMPAIFGGSAPSPQVLAAMSPENTGWFGPGTPQVAMAPRSDVAGRRFDYMSGTNIGSQPRQDEDLSFDQLRALADGLDIVKLCIETRLDQLENLQGGVLPKKKPGQEIRDNADDRCAQLESFFEHPEPTLTFNQWRRILGREMLTIDAPAIYVRRTIGQDVFALEIVDGATITPKIGLDGRAPPPPSVAYQQYLKGVPAVDYTTDELIYMPRNPRIDRIYGFSPVQQLAFTMNIAIRREVAKLNYYTDGNIPDAMMPTPPDWSPEKIANWQVLWNELMSDVRERAGRMKFVPGGGGAVQFLRNDTLLFGQPDEWFARMVCYCFSLPSLPFVAQQNRATAETANEAALEEGLQPLMSWFKSIIDHIIQKVFGYADLEWVWADDDIEPAEVTEIYAPWFDRGVISGDQILGKMGLPPIGLRPFIKGIGPWGYIFVDQMIELAKTGANLLPPGGVAADPAAPPGMPGQPAMLGGPVAAGGGADGPAGLAPGASDPLSGVDPQLLAAVGLGPAGAAGRTANVTGQDEFNADPLAGSVGHPEVLRTLRQAEAQNRARLAKRHVKRRRP